jgi:hypothetical protein
LIPQVEEVPMADANPKNRPNADLVHAVRNYRDQILKLYDRAADKRILVFLDFRRGKVHARPYDMYKSKMREESQALLNQEYVKAVAKNKVLVLVWDDATRRLVTAKFRRKSSRAGAAPARATTPSAS